MIEQDNKEQEDYEQYYQKKYLKYKQKYRLLK
jgi:hypothetical protein